MNENMNGMNSEKFPDNGEIREENNNTVSLENTADETSLSLEQDSTLQSDGQPEQKTDLMSESQPQTASAPEAAYAFRWNYGDGAFVRDTEKKRARKSGAAVYAIVVTAAFAICFAILIATLLLDGILNRTETQVVENTKTIYVREPGKDDGALTVPEIAEKAKNSTVAIRVETETSFSVGTGIIMSEDGYIATNAHVIKTPIAITVYHPDGRELEAELVGSNSENDLAVIKVEGDGFSPASFNTKRELVVGETVVTIGTPSDIELAGTVTTGILSYVDREIDFYDEKTGELERTMTLLQITATLCHGNSGGPLLNDRAEVIGINTMKLGEDFTDVGFAIPSYVALPILEDIIENGGSDDTPAPDTEKRAVIGITGAAVRKEGGAPVSGVYVGSVSDGYDAKEKLAVGDIIVAVEGNEVREVEDVTAIISDYDIGDTVKLKVYRKGMLLDIDVKLGES